MRKKVAALLDRVILYVLYGVILVLPVVVCRGLHDVVLLPKVTVLRVAAALLLLLWASSCVLAGELKWRRTPLDLPLAGLLVMAVVSTVFSMNRQVTLAGAVRQEGLWAYFIYALAYYMSAWYLGRDGRWLTALRLFALSSVVPALMSALQLFGADFNGLFDAKLMTYSAGFGNRPFYGYYLVMVLPVFAYLAWRAWGEKARWRCAAWAAGGAFNLVCLYLTGNRAATLGLFAAAAAAVSFFSLRSPRRRKALLVGLGVVALVAVLLFGAFWGTSYGKKMRSSFSLGGDDNISARFSMWRSALHMMADRPVQGYGLESFYFDYFRYIEKGFNDSVSTAVKENAFAYDNPHNQTLYTGVSLGVLGMLFYLLLYGMMFFRLYRGFRGPLDPWFFGAVFCAALAYFVCVQFLSDLPPVTFYLWVLVGTAVGRLGRLGEGVVAVSVEEPSTRQARGWRGWGRAAGAGVALALVAAVSVTSIVYAVRFLYADHVYYNATKMTDIEEPTIADFPPIIEEVQRAVSLNPLNVNYRMPLYKMYFMETQRTLKDGPVWKAVNTALRESAYYPTYYLPYVTLATAYTYAYALDPDTPMFKQKALGYIDQALHFYPYCTDAKGVLNTLNQL